jgi:tetratricopeptide (TPR) repeat protein
MKARANSSKAAREYQLAAELDPSEPYLFDWGAELLRHHADPQAVEVFTKANVKYSGSVRTLLGLATAYYARGSYDEAAKYFIVRLSTADGRFARLHPENAQANYLYALSLWSQRKGDEDLETPARVCTLLQRAFQLDSHMAPATRRSKRLITGWRRSIDALAMAPKRNGSMRSMNNSGKNPPSASSRKAINCSSSCSTYVSERDSKAPTSGVRTCHRSVSCLSQPEPQRVVW